MFLFMFNQLWYVICLIFSPHFKYRVFYKKREKNMFQIVIGGG